MSGYDVQARPSMESVKTDLDIMMKTLKRRKIRNY